MTNKSNLWKTVYLGLGYQKEKSPSWWWGEQGENGRHCCRGRKLRGHALNQKHKTERVKWIWLKAYSPWHTSFSKAVPSKPLPNVTTKRRVSIQILEPMGDIYHSNHYTITKKKKNSFMSLVEYITLLKHVANSQCGYIQRIAVSMATEIQLLPPN